MILFAGLMILPVHVHAAVGIILPSDSASPFSLDLEYKQRDSVVIFELGSLIEPPETPRQLSSASTGIELGTLLGTPASALASSPDTVSLNLRTFRAFQNQDQVVKTWNRDIMTLMKKTDREKSGPLRIGVELPSAVASVVGEGGAGLQVSGRQRISFAGRSQWSDASNKVSSLRPSKFPSLIMQQDNSFTVEGTIGSKVSVKVDQDSKRQTDLENRIQIRYKGDEDDIIQSVEAGNTTLALPNTQFVGYSQRIQGLFGLKAAATVGPVDLTMITSQEKGNSVRSRVTAGANQNDVTLRDYGYAVNRFFDLGRVGTVGDDSLYVHPGDTIVNFLLFKSVSDPQATKVTWLMDVRHPNRYADSTGTITCVVQGTEGYIMSPEQHYLYLNNTVSQDIKYSNVAYYMRIKRANGEFVEFGDTSVSPYRLQLLKPTGLTADHPLWLSMWKNVYDLGFRNIKYEELTGLDIKKGPPGTETTDDAANLNNQSGVPYLQLFGLDRVDVNSTGNPDGKVDYNNAILNLTDGLLIFPDRQPFDPLSDTIRSVKYPDATLQERVPVIYKDANVTTVSTASKYYIKLTTRRRAASISLGRVNIMSESEVVTLGGQRLNRGSDYTIDYDLGTVTFMRQEALDPNSQLTIDYEYAPFMSIDKRTLFGMRGEYKAGANFHTGATYLYKGSKSTDRPAQLGAEPFRDMVLDYDIYWRANTPVITKLVDALPLVKTSAQSSFTASAEVARSMPNPNTKGNVLVDDFESAKRAYSFSVTRGRWTIASPPLDPLTQLNLRPRGRFDAGLNWFNPYVPFPETAIYRRDIRKGTTTNATVLILDYRPDRSPIVVRDSQPRDSAWGGIMCALPTGAYDQSRAEYIELRMAVVGHGRLHIDLGRISEDVNADRILDSEDGLANDTQSPNGILEDGEDVGLDMEADTAEAGYDPVANPDPEGDDWAAPLRDERGYYTYDRINGTELNGDDPDRYGFPDSEDLGGQSQFHLDFANEYFTYDLDLANPGSIMVDSSGLVSRDVTGYADTLVWITYRIPVWDYMSKVGGSPDSNDIEYARLWINGTTERTRIYVASVSLVQSTWKTVVDTTAQTTPRGRIEIAVKNTEENRDYVSPPGVGGFVDVNGVKEKEQSLLLKYRDFHAGDSGRTRLASATAQDLTGYRVLKMWVHGGFNADTNTNFFFRFGADAKNYYFYSHRLDPGWQMMSIDLDKITLVKEEARQKLIVNHQSFDSLYVYDSTLHLGVRGTPSLSRIAFMELGVARDGPQLAPPDSGEIWFNELSLDDVRRDQGTAARGALTAQMADLLGFTASVETRTYAFRTLNEGRSGSVLNSTGQTNASVNGSIRMDKFVPLSWGMSLPISLNYGRRVSTPKLLIGSDVVLDRQMQDSLQSRDEVQSVTTSFKFSPPSAPWYFKNTFGALGATFTASRQRGTSPNLPVNRVENYNAGVSYMPMFKERGYFSPLSWMRYLMFPRSLYGTKFSIIPTSFTANGNYARSVQTSVNSSQDTTKVDNRNFNGSAKLAMTPITALTLSYDMSTLRSLSGPRDLNLVLNPKEFRLGTEQSFRQRVTAEYKPFIFSFFTHTFNYSADFNDQIENVTITQVRGTVDGSEDHPVGWERGSPLRIPTHNVQLSRTLNANAIFDIGKMWSFLGYKASKTRSAPAIKKTGGSKQQSPRTGENEIQEPGFIRDDKPLTPDELQRQPDQGSNQNPNQNRNQDQNQNRNGQQDQLQLTDKLNQSPEPLGPPNPFVQGPPTPAKIPEAKPAVAGSTGSGSGSSGGFGPVAIWRGILGGFNWVTTPIGPLSITYGHNDAVSQNNLADRPGLDFRFGINTANEILPPIISTTASPGRVPTRSNGDRLDIKNNIKFANILTVSNSYGWSFNWREQSGSSTYTLSEAFPSLSTSFDRLERITPIGWIFTSAAVRSAYSQKFEEAGTGKARTTNSWTTKGWTRGFSPLVNVSGTIRKTIRFGFSIANLTTRGVLNQKQPRPTRTETRSWDANFDYSFSSPKGIPIPLLRGIRLTSQMTMSVRISGKTSQSYVGDSTNVLRPGTSSTELSVSPQANYSFSTRVKGGFTAQWSDSRTDKTKTHIRQLALWAEFTF
ncbi:MAG: cell surface protein SprA [candidate division Zixibacteria bacterium]|nr:cell surface protein SprA [candidate division Zixibacteria bacterium]